MVGRDAADAVLHYAEQTRRGPSKTGYYHHKIGE
jgi:hypothetical protein